MSRFLGGFIRPLLSKQAEKAGYVLEVEQVWEHVCKPPVHHSNGVLGDWPILSDGTEAGVGTRWKCPCGIVNEVVVADPRKPGIRVWRAQDNGSTPGVSDG